MRTVLSLLAVVGLGVFYLVLAFAAAHPRVGAEYRAHYLQRTADCWLPDGLREAGPALPADVTVSELGYPQACLYLRFHWWTVDAGGAWTHPGVSEIRLPWRPGADAVELQLKGPPTAPAPVIAEIGAGADTVRVTLAPGEQRSVRVPLPQAGDHEAWELRVQVQGTGTAPPVEGTLARKVGLGLLRIRYVNTV